MIRSALILCLSVASPAVAQPSTASPAPDAVSVTVYRDSYRNVARPIDLEWPNGYALISETRQVVIPAGQGDVRFEGVAGGIIPESAIVTGFPDGVIEKNQDAYLLSPASLLDRSLGKRVHIRRTSMATGLVREMDAMILSGADGAVVLQTAEGFEALRCTGLPETIVYDQAPAGLSSKPTLSVRTRSSRAVKATVTLSYLATGFDWQANYIATLAPNGDRMDLFAWVTIANGDETSFHEASTQTVAGRVQREAYDHDGEETPGLYLRCWPNGTTTDISDIPPPPPPPAPRGSFEYQTYVGGGGDGDEEAIIVTGMRAIQEELGDLKLYRVPEPVTVAAHSQKQVAMIEQPNVAVSLGYRVRIPFDRDEEELQVTRVLKTRNRKQEGLGLPLPGGSFVLFAAGRERPMLIAEGGFQDKAVDEDVEVDLGTAPGLFGSIVTLDEEEQEDEKYDYDHFELTLGNSTDRAVRIEARFDTPPACAPEDEEDVFYCGDESELLLARGMRKVAGKIVWDTKIPAGEVRSLRYRVREEE